MCIPFIVYAAAAYGIFVTDGVKAYVPRICYIQNVEGIVDAAYECNEGFWTCVTEELEDGYLIKNCWDDNDVCRRPNIRCCHSDYCNADTSRDDVATASTPSVVLVLTATSAVAALARL